MWKTIISWILAIIIAAAILRLVWVMLGFALSVFFEVAGIVIGLIFIFIIAVPVYVIVRKKFIK
ncbi:hypothetical protein ACFLSQ_04860 [Bacteroidota bacterium]